MRWERTLLCLLRTPGHRRAREPTGPFLATGGANITVLSSMSAGGMGPSLAVEGTTTSVVFEAYVEQVLAPTLCSGRVVVMDNLSAHKGERVKEMIEQRGCQLVY